MLMCDAVWVRTPWWIAQQSPLHLLGHSDDTCHSSYKSNIKQVCSRLNGNRGRQMLMCDAVWVLETGNWQYPWWIAQQSLLHVGQVANFRETVMSWHRAVLSNKVAAQYCSCIVFTPNISSLGIRCTQSIRICLSRLHFILGIGAVLSNKARRLDH